MEPTTKIQPTGKRGGKWVVIGEEEYRIPPLGFGALRETREKIVTVFAGMQAGGGELTDEHMQVVADVVHAAITRNYPGMTVEEVYDMLDLGNYLEVLNAVMNISMEGSVPKEKAPPASP